MYAGGAARRSDSRGTLISPFRPPRASVNGSKVGAGIGPRRAKGEMGAPTCEQMAGIKRCGNSLRH